MYAHYFNHPKNKEVIIIPYYVGLQSVAKTAELKLLCLLVFVIKYYKIGCVMLNTSITIAEKLLNQNTLEYAHTLDPEWKHFFFPLSGEGKGDAFH